MVEGMNSISVDERDATIPFRVAEDVLAEALNLLFKRFELGWRRALAGNREEPSQNNLISLWENVEVCRADPSSTGGCECDGQATIYDGHVWLSGAGIAEEDCFDSDSDDVALLSDIVVVFPWRLVDTNAFLVREDTVVIRNVETITTAMPLVEFLDWAIECTTNKGTFGTISIARREGLDLVLRLCELLLLDEYKGVLGEGGNNHLTFDWSW